MLTYRSEMMMKIIGNVCVILLLASASISYGQSQEIRFELMGGGNMSTLKGGGLGEFAEGGKAKAGYGFDVGLRLKQPLVGNWLLSHAVVFSMKNMETDLATEAAEVYQSKFRRSSIDVYPVSLGYGQGPISLHAGPYIGLLAGASQERMGADGKKFRDKDVYGNSQLEGDYMQKLDVGVKVGLDVELSKSISLGAYFVRGLVPIVESAERKDQWRIYNQFGGLSLRFALPARD